MEKHPLPVSTPEREGLSSRAIYRYVKAFVDDNLAMHDVLILRHGKLIYEGYFRPQDETFQHRLYSCSKSFVSVAIGCLEQQGLLSLDDPIVRYFPEKMAGRTVDEYLRETTIRDLLRMASPYTRGGSYDGYMDAWEESFFTDEVSHVPGTAYSYCTTGTTILCYIIRKITGRDFLDVLRPAFDAIGVGEDIFCVESPEGVQWGGSGVCATPRDFAKFANLCMHYGNHEGRQLLPEKYMREATSRQIDNFLYAGDNEQCYGYGYQFWMTRQGGFLFNGMGGQYALCLPKEDMVVVTNGYEELTHASRVFDALGGVFRELVPGLSDGPLPEDPEGAAQLGALTDSLELPHVKGESDSPTARQVSGKTYYMRKNHMNLKTVRLDFQGDEGVLTYEKDSGTYQLRFGLNHNVEQEFPEIYSGRRIRTPAEKGYRTFVSGAWTMPDTLMLLTQVVDVHLAQARLAVCFKDDTITLHGLKHAEWFMDDYQGFASGEWMP